LYDCAYQLARIPSDRFADSLGPLMLYSMLRILDDLERYRALYFKAVSSIAMLSMPLLIFLLVGGPFAIAFLCGNEWVGAGGPLRAMVFGAVFLMLALTLRGLINAPGDGAAADPYQLHRAPAYGRGGERAESGGLVAVAAGISLREAMVFAGMMRVLRPSHVALRLLESLHALLRIVAASAVGLGGGIAAMGYGCANGLGDGLLLPILIGIGVCLCYGLSLRLVMLVWRLHIPLASARSGARGAATGHRSPARPRAPPA
jgi:hypothetical protein